MTNHEMATVVMAVNERITASELKRRTNRLYPEVRNGGIMKGSARRALGHDQDFSLQKHESRLYITRLR